MAAQMPKKFEYTAETPWGRKQEREKQLKENPEVVYETLREELPDKYMFYTRNPVKLLENIKKTFKNDPEEICYKWVTDAGTIMLYCTTGICVIHGDQTKKDKFLNWFDKDLKQDPGGKSADGIAGDKSGDGQKEAGDKSGDGQKKGGDKSGDGQKKGGDKSGDGQKKGGDKSGDGQKKAGDKSGDGQKKGGDKSGDGQKKAGGKKK
ncbi:hypothetical protein CHARACLAT_026161 [Characodon lateralis]|uniref:Uncharacterized protein n=1 Tax=Characodon lateralis TaxID=208331 RepID=A0ABU7DVW6_9TELE|nr:hypothetical protein [Characodon lateralis]